MPPIQDWIRGAKIGQGRFAAVYVGINNDNKKRFAVKSVDSTNNEKKEALENERKALRKCDSKYIVQYLGWAACKKIDSRLKIITLDLFIELVPRGTVSDQVTRNGGSLGEPIVAAYTRDILHGLNYLHELGIVHGDIKCANFLVGNHNVKLCDFGSAKFLKNGDILDPNRVNPKHRQIIVTGTMGWMAPEVEDKAEQGPPSDIFSLGCSIVEMCTGSPPDKVPKIYAFEDFDESTVKVDDDDDFPQCTVDIPPSYSDGCREFVESCFALDPDDRPSAAQLLRHYWILNAPPFPKHVQIEVPQSPRTISMLYLKLSNLLGCGTGTSRG